MSIVSDTTAITTLIKVERPGLLKELFERVFVPQAVWGELKEFHPQLPDFVELRPVRDATQRLPGTDEVPVTMPVYALTASELRLEESLAAVSPS
jgi:hypothetical protein